MSSAAALSPQDLRQAERFDFQLEVTAQSGHQFFTGFSENISAGGLFVSTYQTLPVGSTFEISFKVPGVERTFEAECEVRWVREYNVTAPDMVPGMGVRFVGLSPEDTQLLDQIIKRVETLFYDDDDLA